MNEHTNDYVKEWLGAYLDGQLAEDRRAWVEQHLAGCVECQKELAGLRELSYLLQAEPLPPALLDGAVYAARVAQHLPPSSQPFSRRALRTGLRYAPLGIFGLWAFFQAVLAISSALFFSMRLFPQTQGILVSFTPPVQAGGSGWLGGIFSLFEPATYVLDLPGINWLGPLALINLFVIAVLAMLFLAWLAGLYSYNRVQSEPRYFHEFE